jgi:hypothetical protein
VIEIRRVQGPEDSRGQGKSTHGAWGKALGEIKAVSDFKSESLNFLKGIFWNPRNLEPYF